MTFKKILSVVLGVTALGLFSCASDQNNEDNMGISPEKSVRRTLLYQPMLMNKRVYLLSLVQ